MPISNLYDTFYKKKYSRVWKIDQGIIAQHNQNYLKSGYIPDEVILNWPGNGDTLNNESFNLAPFYDQNSNGKYEPFLGDYPCIYGDQAIFFMFNDNFNKPYRRDSLHFEIHGMMYEYSNQALYLNNTVFVRFWIINRSKNKYHDILLGNWVDFDLGYAFDDYVGCIPNLNMFYSYNGYNFDSLLGKNPPVVGLTYLSDSMSSFMYYNNDYSLKGNPTENIHYYYYLQGKYKNGQKIRHGGDGFNNVWDTSKFVNFMYPDYPDLSEPAWSDMNSSYVPADKRCVGAIGPFNLNPDEVKIIDVAYTYSRTPGYNFIDNVYGLALDSKVLKKWYQNNNPECFCAKTSIEEKSSSDQILLYYLNPVRETLIVHKNFEDKGKIEILSIEGKTIYISEFNSFETEIDFLDYSPGLYIIKYQSPVTVLTYHLIKY